MRGRCTKWIFPTIGDRLMTSITRTDIERIVARLDAAIAAFQAHGPGGGRLSPATGQNVWGVMTHAFDEAVNAKDPKLRVLAVNPCADVRGPEGGPDRQGQILYSDELAKLLEGHAVGDAKLDVPLRRRRMYAMAAYTKTRSSELEAITAHAERIADDWSNGVDYGMGWPMKLVAAKYRV